MKFHKEQFEWSVERFAVLADVPGWTFVTAVQPFPTAYLEADSPVHSKGGENFSGQFISFHIEIISFSCLCPEYSSIDESRLG